MKNRIVSNKLKSIFICSSLFMGAMVLITNCNPDETQDVTNFSTLTMQDEFDVDGAPNPAIWNYNIGKNNVKYTFYERV